MSPPDGPRARSDVRTRRSLPPGPSQSLTASLRRAVGLSRRCRARRVAPHRAHPPGRPALAPFPARRATLSRIWMDLRLACESMTGPCRRPTRLWQRRGHAWPGVWAGGRCRASVGRRGMAPARAGGPTGRLGPQARVQCQAGGP